MFTLKIIKLQISDFFVFPQNYRTNITPVHQQNMIIERESNRRQREQIYRKQLLSDIQEKQQQRQIKNRSRVYDEMPREEFSLIKNIEAEQERRKNKQKEYYQELERQRVEAVELKKRKMEEERLEQEKMDEKIRRENQALRLKYDEQIRKENQKKELKAENKQAQIQNRSQPRHEEKQEPPRKNSIYPKDSIDNLNASPDQMIYLPLETHPDSPNYFQSMGNAQSYPYLSRIENQDYNFPPRKVVNNSYYKELLREKRKLDEETDSLRDLNRMIHSDYLNEGRKYSQGYGKSGGINQLKEISKLIYDQSQFYMKDGSRGTVGIRSKTHGSGMMDSGYYKF